MRNIHDKTARVKGSTQILSESLRDTVKRLRTQLEASKKLNHKYFDTLYKLKKIQLKDGKYIVNREWEIPLGVEEMKF